MKLQKVKGVIIKANRSRGALLLIAGGVVVIAALLILLYKIDQNKPVVKEVIVEKSETVKEETVAELETKTSAEIANDSAVLDFHAVDRLTSDDNVDAGRNRASERFFELMLSELSAGD